MYSQKDFEIGYYVEFLYNNHNRIVKKLGIVDKIRQRSVTLKHPPVQNEHGKWRSFSHFTYNRISKLSIQPVQIVGKINA